MPSVHDGSWDLPPRVSETLVSEYRGDLLSSPVHRIGPGETVPALYVRVTMRALFADALYRLVPETTHDLAGDEARAIVTQNYRALGIYLTPPHDRQPLDEAERRQDRFIEAWQRRYGLLDAWLHVAAGLTMQHAYDLHRLGRTFDAPLVLPGATVLADLDDFRSHRPTDLPGALHKVINAFSPRAETVDDAVKRLMPDLESRLRAELERIVEDDLARIDTQKAVTFRKTTAFEWVARFQVLRESRNEIACADGIDRGHVTKSVNETAALIGLTLRKERGGRPRRKHGPPKVCVLKPRS